MFEKRTPARCGYKCATARPFWQKKWVLDIKLGKAALEPEPSAQLAAEMA